MVQARALLFEAAKNRRLVESDLLRRFSGVAISCLPAVPLARFHLREIFNPQEQYKPKSFLSQAAVDSLLFWRNFSIKSPENLQELCPDPASTALYTDASGTTVWGSVLQSPHEATRSSAGWWASEEVLEMIGLKELKACRHGLHQNVEALHGRTVKLYQSGQYGRGWSSPQDVIQVSRTHDRNQGSCTLTARTQDSPGGGLHS